MTTPPLLALPHNWIARVDVARRWPVAILPARDGTEQRRALAPGVAYGAPPVTVTYQLTTPDVESAGRLFATLVAAEGRADAREAWRVRVPRWEDSVPLLAQAAATDTALSLAGDPTLRAFRPGEPVALWAPEQPVTLVTLAAAPEAVSGADGAGTLLLAGALASGDLPPGRGAWPAGSLVAPLLTGRLDGAVDRERLTGAYSDGRLTIVEDVALVGTSSDDVAGAAGGQAVAPVLTALSLTDETGGDLTATIAAGFQRRLRAVGLDAGGVSVPAPAGLIWTVDLPARLRLVVPWAGDAIAGIEVLLPLGPGLGSPTATVTVTDPVSGLTASYPLGA